MLCLYARGYLASLPEGEQPSDLLFVLCLCRVTHLPSQLFVGCISLATLGAHHNPITVEHLRAAAGYSSYEARREARASKQIGGRVVPTLTKLSAKVLMWNSGSAGLLDLQAWGVMDQGGQARSEVSIRGFEWSSLLACSPSVALLTICCSLVTR